MTYDLLIGDKSYSSWSLRAWLLFEHFDLPVRVFTTEFYQPGFAEDLKAWSPAATVPVVRAPSGALWTDSLAIFEGIIEAHPSLPMLPSGPRERAAARSLMAEMHSGFMNLRADCPMNLRHKWVDFAPSEAVLRDLSRVTALWKHAQSFKHDGPWLFGAYGAVDAFYAPVAARIAGYGLPVDGAVANYVNAHLQDPAFRRWRAMGEARDRTLAQYDKGLPITPWPGPGSRGAKPAAHGPSENAACPYSGKSPKHFMEFDGRVFGFCNATCRDKTAVDPEAWPAFMKVYQS
jgi:glutathione S-transferase